MTKCLFADPQIVNIRIHHLRLLSFFFVSLQPNKCNMHPTLFYIMHSIIFLALPVSLKEKLNNQDNQEGETVTLCCELSNPVTNVQWKKGLEIIKAGEK